MSHVAEQMGVSRATAHKWWQRFQQEGLAGLQDRSSRPKTSPNQTPVDVEHHVIELRKELKLGPARIAGRLGLVASTVHRILTRHGVNRLE